jgi:peptide/nickel transport system substrate-binding protein
VFPKATLFYDPRGAATYNMTKATQALKASGFASGFNFKLTVPSGGSAEATLAQVWKADLQKLGIDLTIQTLDQTTALQEWSSEKYDATVMPWVNDTPDAFEISQYTVSATKPTGVTAFHTGYVNHRAYALAQRAQSELSKSARGRDYAAIQRILTADEPLLYAVDTPVLYGVSSKVHGFTPNRAGNGNYYFNRVTLTK